MKLIVGLGNPGKQYERTRHNVGFVVVDTLATDYGLRTTADRKHQAEVVKGAIEGKRAILAKPQTYMNNSGRSVKALLAYHKLTPADLVVVHDDKDIPLGEIRVQKNRGAAGHNGMLSIIEHLGTKDFARIRVGVAPTEKKIADTANFVLGKFTREEQKILKEIIKNTIENIKKILKEY